ncbi:hypothetical protein GUITHDRAFT_104047 [Guillardia theta CCMP2712]|uniref:Uncharacterized protein n=1 Tax=Guillardia theta (strain CCMP2712) TaxID=905079 RepID=L1JQ77_GUITC|nr:hypothetical protein GUITHDRAFT_104047 [Guillardia theta CCMP2712]EKX50233.1 hypothetical protein GUITHDRAFT_104047 [Guillardia theta CCMP2712]|eukprot:XP_005837213.1 hypothetical protein GUITHDRAFT_104047 [Guillardia theta CCMP2712]
MTRNVELLRALSSLTSEIDHMNDSIKKSYKNYKQRLDEVQSHPETPSPSRRPVRSAGSEPPLVPRLLSLPTPQEMKLVQSARTHRSGIDYRPLRLFNGREDGSMTARCECCKRVLRSPRKPPRAAVETSRPRRGVYDSLDEAKLIQADTATLLNVVHEHAESMQVVVIEENVKLATPSSNALQHRPIEHRLQRWWLELAPSHRQNLYEEMLKSFDHASEIALTLVPEISETCFNPLRLSKLFQEIVSPWMIKPPKVRRAALMMGRDLSAARSRSPSSSHESRMQRADQAISRAKTVLALREISHIIDATRPRKNEMEATPDMEGGEEHFSSGNEGMQRSEPAGFNEVDEQHMVSLTTAQEHWLLCMTMWYKSEGTWRVRELDETNEDRNLLKRIFRDKDISFLSSDAPASMLAPHSSLARVAIKQGMGVSGGDGVSGMFRRSIQILETPRAKVCASLLSRGIISTT